MRAQGFRRAPCTSERCLTQGNKSSASYRSGLNPAQSKENSRRNTHSKAPLPQIRVSKSVAVRAAQAGFPGDGSALPHAKDANSRGLKNPLTDSLTTTASDAAKVLEGPARLLAGIVNAYNVALSRHPVATKALTSLIGFAVGDRIAQLFGGAPFDVLRCARLSMYGFLIDGPIGHYFYQFLDRTICPDDPKGPKSVLTKTAIDQLVWAPLMTVLFLAFLTTLEGRPDAVLSVIHAKLVPIYLANLGIWPIWHIINFRYVPPEQRILFNNLVAVAWTTYLSFSCGGGAGGHSGTARDFLSAGFPCGAQAAATALLKSPHVGDVMRQTAALESMIGGWGTDGLPNAESGAELLLNYATMKAEVVRTICVSHSLMH